MVGENGLKEAKELCSAHHKNKVALKPVRMTWNTYRSKMEYIMEYGIYKEAKVDTHP